MEQALAKRIIKDAEKHFVFNAKTSPLPSMLIDKELYKKHNFEELKAELNKLGYELCELKDAPMDYNKMPLKNKLFAYKK